MSREVYQHKGDNLPRPGEHSDEVLSEKTRQRLQLECGRELELLGYQW